LPCPSGFDDVSAEGAAGCRLDVVAGVSSAGAVVVAVATGVAAAVSAAGVVDGVAAGVTAGAGADGAAGAGAAGDGAGAAAAGDGAGAAGAATSAAAAVLLDDASAAATEVDVDGAAVVAIAGTMPNALDTRTVPVAAVMSAAVRQLGRCFIGSDSSACGPVVTTGDQPSGAAGDPERMHLRAP
jgi:hypothetical protein